MKRRVIPKKLTNLNRIDKVIIGIIFACIVVIFCVMRIGFNDINNNQVNSTEKSLHFAANSYKFRLDEFMSQKVRMLQYIASFPDIYEMNREKQKKFINGRNEISGFDHFFVMDNEGYGYYFSENVVRYQYNEPFFKNISKSNVYITTPFYETTKKTTVTVCVAIMNNGQRVGTLCAAVDLSTVQDLLEESYTYLDGMCFVVQRNGIYISNSDMNKVYTKENIFDYTKNNVDIIEEAFKTNSNTSGKIIMDNIEYQADVVYVEQFDWAIVRCVKLSEVLADIKSYNGLQFVYIVLLLAIMLAIIRVMFRWIKSEKKIYTDELTKVNSRAAFYALINRLQDKKKHDILIMYMDLNKFKFVNDTYGHDTGDEVLCRFADAINKVFGKYGFVARLGGDEFAAVFTDMKSEKIPEIWKELEDELEKVNSSLDIDYRIVSSYGYAVRKAGNNTNLRNIINEADEKMYEYKKNVESQINE